MRALFLSEMIEDLEPEEQYANRFEIGFNAYQFILEFGRQYGPEPGRAHTRIITSPALARGLSELLESSLREYSSKYDDGGSTT